jgi:hypothetical protein
LSIEGDVRLDTAPSGMSVFDLLIPVTGGTNEVYFLANANNAHTTEVFQAADGATTNQTTTLTQFLILGQWMHLRLDVDLVAQSVSTTLDGTLVDTHKLKFVWPAGTLPTFGIGSFWRSSGFVGRVSYHVDNVVMVAK